MSSLTEFVATSIYITLLEHTFPRLMIYLLTSRRRPRSCSIYCERGNTCTCNARGSRRHQRSIPNCCRALYRAALKWQIWRRVTFVPRERISARATRMLFLRSAGTRLINHDRWEASAMRSDNDASNWEEYRRYRNKYISHISRSHDDKFSRNVLIFRSPRQRKQVLDKMRIAELRRW